MRTEWKRTRRRVLTAAISLLAGVFALPVHAEGYPVRPIRLIVPFPPGGGVDNAARFIGQALAQRLGQAIVVENHGGSAGLIAASIAAHSSPDGYTLFFGNSASHGITPNLYRTLPYDPIKDFTPIGLIGSTPYLLVVTPSLPAKDVRGLIALAKSKPGALNYGSAGNGSTVHLTMELFKSLAGVNITHIPYKGAAEELPPLLNGQIAVAFLPSPIVGPLVKDGRLRALAVSSAQRSTLAPGIPTVAEAGVPGFESTGWYGLFGPAKLSQAIVQKLSQTLETVERDPAVATRLANLGIEPATSSPARFAVFVKAEIVKWGKVVRSSGAVVN